MVGLKTSLKITLGTCPRIGGFSLEVLVPAPSCGVDIEELILSINDDAELPASEYKRVGNVAMH
jgi:hypothetical protein